MTENKDANKVFPIQRLANVIITLDDDQVCVRDWVDPKWDATDPPSASEFKDKYRSLAEPILGANCSQSIPDAIHVLNVSKASMLLNFLVGGNCLCFTPTNIKRNFTILLFPMPAVIEQRS